MNYHESGALGRRLHWGQTSRKTHPEHDFGKFVGNLFGSLTGWFLLRNQTNTYVQPDNLTVDRGPLNRVIGNHKDYWETITELADIAKILDSIRVPPSQHALPHRAVQPGRNLELNRGDLQRDRRPAPKSCHPTIAGTLWQEHLGLVNLPVDLQNIPEDPAKIKWVEFWDKRADDNQEAIKKEQNLPDSERIKILKWMPQSDAELYLRDLEVRTKNLRSRADYNFKDCKIDEETLFPWPLL